jgi:hypothetical protein
MFPRSGLASRAAGLPAIRQVRGLKGLDFADQERGGSPRDEEHLDILSVNHVWLRSAGEGDRDADL